MHLSRHFGEGKACSKQWFCRGGMSKKGCSWLGMENGSTGPHATPVTQGQPVSISTGGLSPDSEGHDFPESIKDDVTSHLRSL